MKKAVILIIDDKPENILAMESVLESDDRKILTAQSGSEGLTAALNNNVDVIILDVQMPEMDGFEVAQILHSNKRTKDIPIIFATAESKNERFMMKGYEEGAIDYLYKPVDPVIVRTKVNVLLQLQVQKKELIEKNISLEKSALLIKNSADIIGTADEKTLMIEEMNPAFTRITGYSEKEIENMFLLDFLPEDDQYSFRKMINSEKEQFSIETKINCKDGSVKWLQWKIVARFGKWFINAMDITDSKQVEKVRDYLTTIVKQSNNAIYIASADNIIITWNNGAEKMYGYSESEALGMNVKKIIPASVEELTEKVFLQVFAGRKIQDAETQRITKDGKMIDVLFSGSVVIDPDSGQRSIAITERDITRQKIIQEQIIKLNSDLENNIRYLETTNQDLESFSYSVSHDLRAPLRALSGYSKILEEDYAGVLDDEGKRLLGVINSNAEKMGNLIDDLLAFSRIGRREVSKSKVNMNELVKKVIEETNSYINHNAEIIVHELPDAEADYNLLYQVWTNLISNAIKYSSKEEKPVVEIGSTISKSQRVYYVKDNGVGFKQSFANKLFGVFQRLHSSAEFEGNGVGLAIVQRIISKHGGKIWAESVVNEGAAFYFTLS